MNSVKMVWPLLPMVKYEPQYARAIGKWMNNNVSACRLFYPDEIPAVYQWLPQQKDITRGVIAYEGLRKTDDYGKPELKGMSPEANGGEFHESLTSLAAILGGGLNGIDKTNQNGYNFVKMVQDYFNSDNGWNIVMNNTNPDVVS